MSQLEQLCTSCARCCAGVSFIAVSLDAEEQRRFGVPVLPQPCPHLVGKRCGVYAQRPRACSAYLCPVAAELARGGLTLEQARTRLDAPGPGR